MSTTGSKMKKLNSKCCGAKVLMMFPTGADNQGEKLPDRCSRCYKPLGCLNYARITRGKEIRSKPKPLC